MAQNTPSLPDQKEAEYGGETVTLYDPFRIEDDEKKFGVYVENPDSGNVNKVKFGSGEMEIKRDDDGRRKSFRARMQCDDLDESDKHKAKFWSCVFWRSDISVSEILSENKKQKEWKLRGEIRSLIKEEQSRPSGKHALKKLKTIHKFSGMLFDLIDKNEDLDHWVMDKFAMSESELNDVYQYLESKKMGL